MTVDLNRLPCELGNPGQLPVPVDAIDGGSKQLAFMVVKLIVSLSVFLLLFVGEMRLHPS